jgi:Flp pilus assembly protein TadD
MAAEDNAKGWFLHSHGQGRKFGPLTEDELRSYFRAGMVKSVDRLSAPGEATLVAAGEVAGLLGESVPVGPPPPAPVEPPPVPASPLPSPGAGISREAAAFAATGLTAEERAARAAAAMNIDIASLMVSNVPAKKESSGWLLPVLGALFLLVLLFLGPNMMRKLGSANPGIPAMATTDVPDASELADPAAAPLQPSLPDAGRAGRADPQFETRFAQAEAMKNARAWTELAAHAQAWAQAQPELDEPLHYYGLSQAMLGDFGRAEEAFRKVIARRPDDKEVQALLADTYLQERKFPEALSLYKEMTVTMPDDARVWNNYGAALNGIGQGEQAAAALENAVRLDPGFKQAWTNLGNLYQSRGEKAKADAAFARAR